MKFLVVISALVAAAYAEAEADPALLYGNFGYAGGLYGAYGYSALKSAPCVNAANVPVPCAGATYAHVGYPYAAYGAHYYGKREAEAEPEADPALLYGGYAGGLYGAYGYSALKSAPCVNAANVPVPCAGATYAHVGYPYAAYGAHYYGKREAEAEPEADPALLYGSYAAYPAYGAYHGYAGLGYAAGIPNPVHAVAATPFGLTHSSNVGLCTNYLGAAVPCGRKKREADAEADPALLYGAYAAYPAYGAYPYATYGTAVAATNNVLGHAVAYNAFGLGAVHSSHVGVCTNYLGAQVPC